MSDSNKKEVLLGTAAVVGVGALAYYLTKGNDKKSLKKTKKKVNKFAHNASDKFEDWRDEAEDKVEDAKETISDFVNDVLDYIVDNRKLIENTVSYATKIFGK
ncbi:hypothetical protein SAMN05443429_103100 [Cruoricaptor ignavus]|uniref:YtxH-like protein n=1 Tax=Cruoricaptor ignavus TaxID=1118202 RepID=A0A1M6D3C3_9FLAO|nr:hypothetical protein [Cruoricaptor ignavus]QOR73525.1 hypothetical protein IMZ16_08365 [Cruoricaptor ignavus]SHI67621.1 hypothetical protein SAMN05443429_103100 [Cruoricaptor ignavus]